MWILSLLFQKPKNVGWGLLSSASNKVLGISNICVDSLLGEKKVSIAGLFLCLGSANERRRYFVTTSLIGWA